MAKVTPRKPDANAKAGKELPYKNVEDVVGGPVCNNPEPGLQSDKEVKGSKALPPIKNG